MDIKATRPVPEIIEDEPLYEEPPMGMEPETTSTASKQRKTSNIVLVSLALFLLAFIVTMTVIFCVKGSVPDTLIQCTLGAGGLEALVLAGIKISKVLSGDKPDMDGSNDGVG